MLHSVWRVVEIEKELVAAQGVGHIERRKVIKGGDAGLAAQPLGVEARRLLEHLEPGIVLRHDDPREVAPVVNDRAGPARVGAELDVAGHIGAVDADAVVDKDVGHVIVQHAQTAAQKALAVGDVAVDKAGVLLPVGHAIVAQVVGHRSVGRHKDVHQNGARLGGGVELAVALHHLGNVGTVFHRCSSWSCCPSRQMRPANPS